MSEQQRAEHEDHSTETTGRRDREPRPDDDEASETLDVPLADAAARAGGGADGRRPAAGPHDAGHRGRLPARRGRRGAATASPRSTPSRAAASTCATSRAAGATTPARSTPRVVERFVLDGQQARLTQAALETLAVVAYKQPVSRARVSAVRGVNVDGVMRTLVSRGLVEEAGTDAETTARALPHHELLPGADRGDLARGPARAGAVPAGHGRLRRPRRAAPRARRRARRTCG